MALYDKIKEYVSEPIIRLIIYNVLFIILIAGIVFYANYHADRYYKEPAKKNILNQNSKHDLTHIITRELLKVDAQYRAMLLSRNTKHIKNLEEKILKSINRAQNVLPVLQNGGTIIDVVPVNFYNKDEIREEITYLGQKKDKISIDVVNLSPKFVELKLFIDKSSRLLIEEISKENPGFISDNFELILLVKQTEALLLRLHEGANKICYDVMQANKKFEQKIIKAQSYVARIVLFVEVIGNSLVILLAGLIAFKIFNILETKKEAEIKIEQANQAMNTIIDNIPVGVILVNSNKKIIQINEQAAKILKYKDLNHAKLKLLGAKCHIGFCEIEADQCPILDLGEPKLLFTERKLLPGGEEKDEITILKSVIPIILNGQYVLMEVFVDISERKMHEQALEEYRENLEYLVKERTKKLEVIQKELISKAVEAGRAQLSAMVLHNIGNAITPVNINFKTLKSRELSDINQYLAQCYNDLKSHKQDLGSYVTNNDRGKKVATYMGELIESFEEERKKQDDKLLKIETGLDYISEILSLQQSYSSAKLGIKQKINFNFLVKDSITMQQSSIDKRNITLTLELGNNIPELIIEKNKLMQVMVNLIKNSCDAITQLSECEGTTSKENFINITTSFSGNTSSGNIADKKIKFTIIDSGIGIEKDKLDKIFEFGVSTKGSSGFGLYYCKTFVESNNGILKVESKGKGKGTSFFMEFTNL